MSLILFYVIVSLAILALPFIIDLNTVWLSFFFGALFFFIILKLKNSDNYIMKSTNIQLLIASIVIIFPFIVSILTFVEYGVVYTNILPGILVMDMALIFFQHFIVLPFSLINPPRNSGYAASNPVVSIIVPAYNEEKWIKQTLESLVEVDYIKKEILVIDDGSTDNTYFIASMMTKTDKSIKVFKKSNGGKASAINYGLLVSSGDIIVVTDADGLVSRDSLSEIVELFKDPKVVGVAGNIRVINKSNVLTCCQAIEYAVGINLYRAATASFGIVDVLPGPLSAFRRSTIDMVGRFDSDTIVEDADFTKKLLKTGDILQCTSNAYAYTEVPSNFRDFVKQRMRWYRGNIQTILKHRDLRYFSGNIFLSSILIPLSFLQIFVQPWLGPLSLLSFVYSVYSGNFAIIQKTFIVFLIMQVFISYIAVKKGGEDIELVFYSPFLIIGYKHLIDVIKIKCIFDHFIHRPVKWNKLDRTGPSVN